MNDDLKVNEGQQSIFFKIKFINLNKIKERR